MVFIDDQLDWETIMRITEPSVDMKCDLPKKKKKRQKPNPDTPSIRTKSALNFDQLDIRSQHIYKLIRIQCPTDKHLQAVLASMPTRQSLSGCSGRSIDYLVTHFTTLRTPGYYLDISKPSDPFLVDRNTLLHPNHKYIYVDIGHAYKQNMSVYSKCFFDCFKRGKPVLYLTESGESVELYLGQVMFFIWVCKFKVLDFLMTIRPQLLEAKKKNTLETEHPGKLVSDSYITWVIFNPSMDLEHVTWLLIGVILFG